MELTLISFVYIWKVNHMAMFMMLKKSEIEVFFELRGIWKIFIGRCDYDQAILALPLTKILLNDVS